MDFNVIYFDILSNFKFWTISAKFQCNVMLISVFKMMLKIWSKLYFLICCVSFFGEYIMSYCKLYFTCHSSFKYHYINTMYKCPVRMWFITHLQANTHVSCFYIQGFRLVKLRITWYMYIYIYIYWQKLQINMLLFFRYIPFFISFFLYFIGCFTSKVTATSSSTNVAWWLLMVFSGIYYW